MSLDLDWNPYVANCIVKKGTHRITPDIFLCGEAPCKWNKFKITRNLPRAEPVRRLNMSLILHQSGFYGSAHLLTNTTPTTRHGGISVTLWGCILAAERGRLDSKGRMNTAKYEEVFKENLHQSASDRGDVPPWQHENDMKHTSKTCWRSLGQVSDCPVNNQVKP